MSSDNISRYEVEGQEMVYVMLRGLAKSLFCPFLNICFVNALCKLCSLLFPQQYSNWANKTFPDYLLGDMLEHSRLRGWIVSDYRRQILKQYLPFLVVSCFIVALNRYSAGHIPDWWIAKTPLKAIISIFLLWNLVFAIDAWPLFKWHQYQKKIRRVSLTTLAQEVSAAGIPVNVLRVMWWITPHKQRRDSIAEFKDDFELVEEDLGLEEAQKWAKGEAVKTVGQVLCIWLKSSAVGSVLAWVLRWAKAYWNI